MPTRLATRSTRLLLVVPLRDNLPLSPVESRKHALPGKTQGEPLRLMAQCGGLHSLLRPVRAHKVGPGPTRLSVRFPRSPSL